MHKHWGNSTVCSAAIILGLVGLYFAGGGSFDLIELAQKKLDPSFQYWAFPLTFLGFCILGSTFPFHTWSPLGHSAAPTAISMFLAGVHMKLGGYGCLRVCMYAMPEGSHDWMWLFLILATVSVVYGAFIATQQRDLKFINAYASISHVGLVVFGFAVLSLAGVRGGVLQMVSHGFCTAVVFALIGQIYVRSGTRMVDEMGGLMKKMPFISVCFVLAGFAVVGMPGTSSFVAEFTIFVGGMSGAKDALTITCALLCISSVVVTAVYVLRTVNRVVHGPLMKTDRPLPDATMIDRLPIVILLACIFAIGLMPGWMVDAIDASLIPIMNNLGR